MKGSEAPKQESSDGGEAPKTGPFLKWAGGKGRLLSAFEKFLPRELSSGRIKKYFEPMVGGGAMFFHLAQRYPFTQFFISDINEELVLAYKTVQFAVRPLIQALAELQSYYHGLDKAAQERHFYSIRSRFNERKHLLNRRAFSAEWVERTAQLIFLNKTCYNGLYRVNRRGRYNVPFGRYNNPTICDVATLTLASALLQRAEIREGNFDGYAEEIDEQSFVYFDPPYRPLSKTASFTSYAKGSFNDQEQLRLAAFFRSLHEKGAALMLSNSDPRNVDAADDFFERAYDGFAIHRIPAVRMINSNASKRGAISELLIVNYPL